MNSMTGSGGKNHDYEKAMLSGNDVDANHDVHRAHLTKCNASGLANLASNQATPSATTYDAPTSRAVASRRCMFPFAASRESTGCE